jgi:hypothetical protein
MVSEPPRSGYDERPSDTYFGKPHRERGGCLTIWLWLTLFGYFYSLLFTSAVLNQLQQALASGRLPVLTWLMALIFIAGSLSSIVWLYGIWTWKRWGVFGMLGLTGVQLVAATFSGIITLDMLIGGALGAAIFYWLIKPKWAYFE